MEFDLSFITTFLNRWLSDHQIQTFGIIGVGIIGIVLLGILIIQWYIIADFENQLVNK